MPFFLLLPAVLLLLLPSAARGDPAFSRGDDSLDDAEEEHGRDMGDTEIAEADRISSGALKE